MTKKENIKIEGMTCASCVARIEKVVSRIDGVGTINVNLATEKATVVYDESKTDTSKIMSVIEKAGFKPMQENHSSHDHMNMDMNGATNLLGKRFYISASLTIVILILSMGAMVPAFSFLSDWSPNPYIQLVLSLIVLLYGGHEFYTHAFKNIFNPDMDTLVTMGSFAAWIYSTILVATGHGAHLYFEATAVIITFVLLGRSLEKKAKKNVAESVNKLMDLAPKTAIIIKNNEEMTIRAENIDLGDVVILKPGSSVATDGVIVSGVCYIDESMLTGESRPISKKEGSQVFAGTVVVNGSANFKAEKVGKDTVLASIIQMVSEASGGKAKIQRIADKIASIFVPAVLGIAILSLIIWFAITGNFVTSVVPFVSVLVIACPCALGLAIPTAIISGVGRGAKEGVLIKNGEVLERAARLHVCIFDKTGTLTTGDFSVSKVTAFGDFSPSDVLKYAASAEKQSEHPIAQSIVKYAYSLQNNIDKIEPVDFDNKTGAGVTAKVGGRQVIVGKAAFLEENGITIDANIAQEEAFTTVFVGVDNLPAGIISLGDAIRENAAETIEELKKMGILSVIVSGDNKDAVASVAKKLGIEKYFASVSPEGKMKIITDFQQSGKRVVMVGDGINDAAALASADIGIALASGTDVAMAAGDMTIIGGDLSKLPMSFKLAKKSNRIIKENLFWAFIYNVLAIPLAAGALYPIFHTFLNPAIAGIAMAFSSVTVVMNSLRLKTFKLK